MLNNITSTTPLGDRIKAKPLLSNIQFGLIYLLFSQVGLGLSALYGLATPIWPASGLALVAVSLAGRKLLPGLFFSAFISHLLSGVGLSAAFSIGSGCLLEAYFAYWLLRPARALSPLLGNYTNPVWIITCSVFAPIIAACLGVFGTCFLSTSAQGVWLSDLWRLWWAANALGMLTVTPLLLSLKRPEKLSLEWSLRSFAFTVMCAVACIVIFRSTNNSATIFIAFPLLLAACAWFGASGASIFTFAFVFFTIGSQVIKVDFTANLPYQAEAIFLMNIFLFVLCVTSMFLACYYKKDRFFIPAIILLLGWFVSAWLYHSLNQASSRVDDLSFEELVADSEGSILGRYNSYVDSLRASAAFYLESEEVSGTEWRNFVNYLNIPVRYPGISGLGVILPFRENELEAYVSNIRENMDADFQIKKVSGAERPPVDRLGYSHYIIDRIEPLEDNPGTVGMDLASESKRQAVGIIARDSGNPAVSESIQIGNDIDNKIGFLLLMPMYDHNLPMETIDQRRDAFVGWTYAPVISETFFKGILQQKAGKIDFVVFDSEQITQSNLVYSTDPNWSPAESLDYTKLSRINIGQRRYSFTWKRGEQFTRNDVYSAPIAAGSLSLGVCFLAGIIVTLQSTSRSANRIVAIRTAELQQVNNTLREEVIERKRAEEVADFARQAAEAANLAKSEFLATMSHEIRTPMNSVLGFSELLNSSKLTSEQRLWTSYIRGSGQSLLAIINDILDFSKIEAGKMDLERIPFSIQKAIEEIVGSFQANANEKGLQLACKIASNIPERVIGDPTRFKQITTNLTGNALKFTEHGSVQIDVDWEGDQSSGHITLKVIDTGVGISEEKLATLFEKFTQVDSSTTRKFGGTGLGLAICKKLVELMDGEIQATSETNIGTTMQVKLPYQVPESVDTPIPKATVDDSLNKQVAQYNAEVLLVDDNAVNRKLGMTILQRMGCQVTLACNGQEAVEAVKMKKYSIIFMDCRMPILDGFSATRQIRELEAAGIVHSDKEGKALPILALTANVTNENRQECLDSGMNDHLKKPCKIGDFKNALDTFYNAVA